MKHTPVSPPVKTVTLALIVASSVATAVKGDLAVDWNATLHADDFGLSATSTHAGTALGAASGDSQRDYTWVRTYWSHESGELLETAAIIDHSGKILARKSCELGESYVPRWIASEFAIMSRSFYRPGEPTQDATLVWKFGLDGAIIEEPFPFAGDIRGANVMWAEPHQDGSKATGLYTVQETERSVTIRKISWAGNAVARATLRRKGTGIEVSAETVQGQSYRVQSSKDLEQWENNERIIGDGNTLSVERLPTEPQEFLRVIVE